jgi:SAM-dependent methyltransferase
MVGVRFVTHPATLIHATMSQNIHRSNLKGPPSLPEARRKTEPSEMSHKAGFLPSLWMRAMQRNIQFSDAHRRLDLLYRLPDPWGMESEREQYRFRETNSFLCRQLGPVGTLLEVGCGEGHQTLALQQVARSIVGVDVSRTAIQRAKARASGVTFVAGDIVEAPEFGPPRRFDVVTACELLYYVQDVPTYISTLERLGRHILATYVDTYNAVLEPVVMSKPGVAAGKIQFEGISWTIALWAGDLDSSPAMQGESDLNRDQLG